MQPNKGIRDYAKLNGVKLWQIADRLGITDGNFSRKLRHELSDDDRQKIVDIIDEIAIAAVNATATAAN
ncbi:hypothetical protein [Ruminococcus sp.]|uniref:hypothetical protein n=1 Tax=Ruminococcus sp. TaxID=41978 RepID=UPI00388E4DAB